MTSSLLDFFPPGFTPRAEQARLLAALGDAVAEAEADARAPRVFLVEAPPGVGKSHLAITLARWSGDAYLLTSQKLLQDQYEREFAGEVQLVKGRDNYLCERYPAARVPTSRGMCRRPRGPSCHCPYARARAAALAGRVFCTNTAYFATLRRFAEEQLPRRRLLAVDEAHNLEAQLVGTLTVALGTAQMRAWFGGTLPRLDSADAYRPILAGHLERMQGELARVEEALLALHPPAQAEAWLAAPPSVEEERLLETRDSLHEGLASIRAFVAAREREWVARHGENDGQEGDRGAPVLELIPLAVAGEAPGLLWDAGDIIVLTSAFLGRRELVAESLGLPLDAIRVFACDSPFSLEQRPIVYRPVGALSRATLPALEPLLFAEVAAILRGHAGDKGLVHAASHAAARRLARALVQAAPDQAARLILVEPGLDRAHALDVHRASPLPTVLLSPSLREGVDLPDDLLRFQVITKMPFPDLGDPWTAARRQRDPRWYALETAKALVQAYGRACRHAGDHGTTYVLDAHFERFVRAARALLPDWFLEAADAARRRHREATATESM